MLHPPPMDYAFSSPLPGLSLLQRLLWPLIYVQLIALRDWVRQHYGRGVPYWITISKFGRVRLRRLPTDSTLSFAAPASYAPAGYDYACGLTRACLSDAFCDEDAASVFVSVPVPVAGIAPMPQTQSGQALAARPDTS
ncbi:hypothetical protein K1X12_05035 [Hyphomonas sp. WL0036]|uniref:hypothetical protein n=1 Tax=Hyphomonas sediminis TaxID=2866160 RepID=UPI001C80AFE1|nr:hypothetical protein [Hyphomonas sediminis]MBY9066251.1 hypothetical protein [Hyphomonas sediminis]